MRHTNAFPFRCISFCLLVLLLLQLLLLLILLMVRCLAHTISFICNSKFNVTIVLHFKTIAPLIYCIFMQSNRKSWHFFSFSFICKNKLYCYNIKIVSCSHIVLLLEVWIKCDLKDCKCNNNLYMENFI